MRLMQAELHIFHFKNVVNLIKVFSLAVIEIAWPAFISETSVCEKTKTIN